jgi:hypothetical protein
MNNIKYRILDIVSSLFLKWVEETNVIDSKVNEKICEELHFQLRGQIREVHDQSKQNIKL